MPLSRRLPKVGFDNRWKKVYSVVNLGDLERFEEGTVVTAQLLKETGVISKIEPKVLGDGALTKKLTVQAAKFSKSAVEKLEKLGGKAEVL